MRYCFLVLCLLIIGVKGFSARIDTFMVTSKCMNKPIPNWVIVPDGYAASQKPLPVVYLLHGAGGDYKAWASNIPDILKYADQYNVILVCPDGASTSWYYDSPIDDKMKYETYIASELVGAIDQRYTTIKARSGRAITGYSMGGHGAFYLAFKHQDIWGAAGSLSGGVDIRPFPNNWDIHLRLGKYADHKNNWERNTVINMLDLLKGDQLKLIFDCGVDDFFYDVNRSLHQKLLERKIPHDYIERPGDHGWVYWSNAIKFQMLFFSNYFNSQH